MGTGVSTFSPSCYHWFLTRRLWPLGNSLSPKVFNITIPNNSRITVRSSNKNNFMAGDHHMKNCIFKGSWNKFENYCLIFVTLFLLSSAINFYFLAILSWDVLYTVNFCFFFFFKTVWLWTLDCPASTFQATIASQLLFFLYNFF